MKVKITQVTSNTFNVEMIGMTTGRVAALKHALEKYAEEGSVAADIQTALDNAVKQNEELYQIVK